MTKPFDQNEIESERLLDDPETHRIALYINGASPENRAVLIDKLCPSKKSNDDAKQDGKKSLSEYWPVLFWISVGALSVYAYGGRFVAGIARFADRHPLAFFWLFIYFSGAVINFFWTFGAMIWRYLSRNSTTNRNFWLMGMNIDWVGGLLLAKGSGKKPRKDDMGLMLAGAFVMALSAVSSWLGILGSTIGVVASLWSKITTPTKLKEFAWRAAHIEYQRAEDFLQLLQEGYMPGGVSVIHDLPKIKEQVEAITDEYAALVYPGNTEKAEAYLRRAKELTKKKYQSEVIHPSFWAIRPTEKAADAALMGFDTLTGYLDYF